MLMDRPIVRGAYSRGRERAHMGPTRAPTLREYAPVTFAHRPIRVSLLIPSNEFTDTKMRLNARATAHYSFCRARADRRLLMAATCTASASATTFLGSVTRFDVSLCDFASSVLCRLLM